MHKLGDTPVACAGVAELWAGVAELWAYLSPWAKENRFYLIKNMRNCLHDIIAKNPQIHRIQCYVRPEHYKLPALLGLRQEAILTRYFPDKQNAVVYSKVL